MTRSAVEKPAIRAGSPDLECGALKPAPTVVHLNEQMDGAALSMNLPLAQRETTADDVSALVRRASAGDMQAFERLYRANVGRVHGAILRLVGMDRARAEELTQEAFVRAWQKLSSFRHESAFSTWLYRLGVNTALMELRSRREETHVDD